MAVKVHVGSLPDVCGVEAVPQRKCDLGRIKHPKHPGVLLLAEGDALVGGFAGENEAVVGSRGGEGEYTLSGITVRADRHCATLERNPILSAYQQRSISDDCAGGVIYGRM